MYEIFLLLLADKFLDVLSSTSADPTPNVILRSTPGSFPSQISALARLLPIAIAGANALTRIEACRQDDAIHLRPGQGSTSDRVYQCVSRCDYCRTAFQRGELT